jgi:hypothetical protein
MRDAVTLEDYSSAAQIRDRLRAAREEARPSPPPPLLHYPTPSDPRRSPPAAPCASRRRPGALRPMALVAGVTRQSGAATAGRGGAGAGGAARGHRTGGL